VFSPLYLYVQSRKGELSGSLEIRRATHARKERRKKWQKIRFLNAGYAEQK
jgi:hypothetical protein